MKEAGKIRGEIRQSRVMLARGQRHEVGSCMCGKCDLYQVWQGRVAEGRRQRHGCSGWRHGNRRK